jgi:hypothetical protein
MKSELENRIIGELLTQEKYRLIESDVICEVVRDTLESIHKIQREVQDAERLCAECIVEDCASRGRVVICTGKVTNKNGFFKSPPAERFQATETPEIRAI